MKGWAIVRSINQSNNQPMKQEALVGWLIDCSVEKIVFVFVFCERGNDRKRQTKGRQSGRAVKQATIQSFVQFVYQRVSEMCEVSGNVIEWCK